MICREWQKMIPGFLDDTLETQELEGFVKHVRTCKDCYEELEIMFMLSIGLKELKEDRSISYNFSQLLEDKIEEAEDSCHRVQTIYRLNIIIMILLHVCVIAGIGIQILMWM